MPCLALNWFFPNQIDSFAVPLVLLPISCFPICPSFFSQILMRACLVHYSDLSRRALSTWAIVTDLYANLAFRFFAALVKPLRFAAWEFGLSCLGPWRPFYFRLGFCLRWRFGLRWRFYPTMESTLAVLAFFPKLVQPLAAA